MSISLREPWREVLRKTLIDLRAEVERVEEIYEGYRRFAAQLEEMRKRIDDLLVDLNKPSVQRERLLKETQSLQAQLSYIKSQLQLGVTECRGARESKSVSIEVPGEIWVLVSKDELLKKAMERIAVEEFRKLLLKYFVAEEITGVVDENEIARIDEELKEKIWEELKQKWKL